MTAALRLTHAGPLERAAHATGVFLLRWSERRVARAGQTRAARRTPDLMSPALVHEARSARTARELRNETLAAQFPRIR
ncbi:hypothetical protein ABC270_01340 [Curtobacterium sp. 1P10AnD]|uniref:hypothetical protein n=1 Tax=Curtobacterium sp. 1P10AnD TaxID=3132283 RepID=UPI00399FA909